MDGATLVTTIKAWWSAFRQMVIDAARSGRAMLVRKAASPAVAEVRPRREQPQQAEPARQGESWLLKEPEWFAAVLILGFLGIIEALSWATAGWPPCLVASDDQTPSVESGRETCATFSEGVGQLIGFLWDRADHNAVTGLAALAFAIFTWRLWRSSERMWRVTEVAAGSAKRSADALVVAEQAHRLLRRHHAVAVGGGEEAERALAAAELLNKEGISVEVIDPRTVAPLDIDTIAHSVRKTGRLLIVDENFAPYGFGAEIAAQLMDRGFDDLDAPIRRLNGAHTPTPYSPPLESAVVPNPTQIAQAIRDLMAE
jgi:hypothetical protein